MANTTQQRLDLYLDAEAKILGGQEVRFGDRTLRYADLREIRSTITNLQRQVTREGRAKRGGNPLSPGVVRLPGEGGC